jgi:UDP-N-acetyl-D-galactosamine dehydrogenase
MKEELLSGKKKIAVVGMGYVGLPLSVEFSDKGVGVIGFDLNDSKINIYKKGIDPTNEVGNKRLSEVSNIEFTSEPENLKKANFYIVAVPTPVGTDNVPNLGPVKDATKLIGKSLSKGSYVIFESTVYPGVTEDICIPILEKESGLTAGADFKVGYSPERVNPGDKINTVSKIIKIVSGMDAESLDVIASVYEIVIEPGVYRATSIKVAEAAKVIENAQRDVNIAFVNELSMIFEKMNIDTQDVLEAAGTKWNFLPFKPGLVGGHCIGVDPYYLTYKSEQVGYISKLILGGRQINNQMTSFIAEKVIKMMIQNDVKIKDAKVLILGLTFKENCPDLRNSKVVNLIRDLEEFGVNVIVSDPIADPDEAKQAYGIELEKLENINNVEAIICAVKHDAYTNLNLDELDKITIDAKKVVLVDLKGCFDKNAISKRYISWRL